VVCREADRRHLEEHPVTGTETFGWIVLLVAAVGVAGVLSNRLTAWIRVPAPGIVLAATAIVVRFAPGLHLPTELTVERLVSVALIGILFNGGMDIGRTRFRTAATPILVVGVAGTFLTAAGAAAFLHVAVGLGWYPSLLVGTAVAPTDPAVVFAVLGGREISGLGGALLEGESGANDPVGIALMASLISAGSLSAGAFGHVAGGFVLQMGVGAAVGILGGYGLLWFMTVALPSEGLYPIRTLACAFGLFGIATVAHGSGFLAVFVAGIMVGDERKPYQREIEHFHSAVASLAETVAFVLLGLTVSLREIGHLDVWAPGLALGVVLAVVIRPLLVGVCLTGSALSRNERGFVLFAGLKGAVPILLGSFLLAVPIADTARLYGIVVVVVMFSIVAQGGLVPTIARLLKVPMTTVDPQPWAVGVRLYDEPVGAQRFTVAAGSPAHGLAVQDLPADLWVSLLIRAGQLVPLTRHTVLRKADDVLVVADPNGPTEPRSMFDAPASP
jgi:cell volume regulation protein A